MSEWTKACVTGATFTAGGLFFTVLDASMTKVVSAVIASAVLLSLGVAYDLGRRRV